MTKAEIIYSNLRGAYLAVLKKHQVDTNEKVIAARGLSTEEALGNTARKDYPILTGKEVLLQAEYKGCFGQAFTDAPAEFCGSLHDILEMDLLHDAHARGLFFSSMNAVLKYLGLTAHTIHCREKEPADCAPECISYLKEHYETANIALVGYQPSLLEGLSAAPEFQVRCLDLNPENIGQTRCGVTVEHGIRDYDDVVISWADVILCTSSVFANATMDRYIDIGKEVLFFGITGAGAVELLHLKRFCPLSK